MLFVSFYTVMLIGCLAWFAITLIEPEYRKICWIPLVLFALASIPHITGLYPNYQHGKGVFTVKDNWEGGLMCKSYDTYICYPTDDDHSIVMFKFSTQDPKVADALKANVGKRVEITYRTWYLSPAWLSSTNEPLEVTPVDTKVVEKETK